MTETRTTFVLASLCTYIGTNNYNKLYYTCVLYLTVYYVFIKSPLSLF